MLEYAVHVYFNCNALAEAAIYERQGLRAHAVVHVLVQLVLIAVNVPGLIALSSRGEQSISTACMEPAKYHGQQCRARRAITTNYEFKSWVNVARLMLAI